LLRCKYHVPGRLGKSTYSVAFVLSTSQSPNSLSVCGKYYKHYTDRRAEIIGSHNRRRVRNQPNFRSVEQGGKGTEVRVGAQRKFGARECHRAAEKSEVPGARQQVLQCSEVNKHGNRNVQANGGIVSFFLKHMAGRWGLGAPVTSHRAFARASRMERLGGGPFRPSATKTKTTTKSRRGPLRSTTERYLLLLPFSPWMLFELFVQGGNRDGHAGLSSRSRSLERKVYPAWAKT
jgi:hypothetical protein